MQSILRVISAAAVGLLSASAAPGLPESPQPAVVFWLIPQAPVFKSIADVSLRLEFESSVPQREPIDRVEYEVRDPLHHLRLGRLPYFEQLDRRINDRHPIKGLEYGVSDRFDREDLWQLANAGLGVYQVALLVNGVRASNVVQFTIDPAFDVGRQPALSLEMLEAPPSFAHGLPLLWFIGPKPPEKTFTGLAVKAPVLRVDGIDRKEQVAMWDSRGERPVPASFSGCSLIRIERYEPAFDSSTPHDFQAEIGTKSSGTVHLDLMERPLGNAWDASSPTLADAPRPPPILQGDIVDQDGRPYAGMIVDLDVARTTSDEHGHYSITNLPAGEYSISCHSPFRYPTWAMGVVPKLDPNHPKTVNISFEARYSIGGRITHHGHGLSGIKVNAYWRKVGGNASCVTQSVTDADGYYVCRGPYSAVDGVGINDDGKVTSMPPNRENVHPGMQDVNFRL